MSRAYKGDRANQNPRAAAISRARQRALDERRRKAKPRAPTVLKAPEPHIRVNVPLIYAWARTGATVLNRCLLAMGHAVLSEVHPSIHTGIHSAHWQARNWFNVDIPKGTPWLSCVDHLDRVWAERENRAVVVRDWTINSFYTTDFNGGRTHKDLRTHVLLGNGPRTVAYVRNAVDCALSFAKFHGWSDRQFSKANRYAKAYLVYVDKLIQHKIPIVRYEHFCRDPDAFLQNLCNKLGIRFSDGWKFFFEQTNVLGDTQKKRSRAANATVIKVLPRHKLGKQLTEYLQNNRYLRLADERLREVYGK